MTVQLCGRRADPEHLNLGDRLLEIQVLCEVARVEERERIREIVEHSSATDRPNTAMALALETDLPAAAVSDLLEKMPRELKTRGVVRGRS
jgi:crotonobetainyl-CoA:carnitine CoA-transferase CaiB-like acyl-CoA transferase